MTPAPIPPPPAPPTAAAPGPHPEVHVPFCEDCDKYWSPNSMPPDGTCPSCGRTIAEAPESRRAPWHFWVLVIALVLYLGWRAIQGVQWLLG